MLKPFFMSRQLRLTPLATAAFLMFSGSALAAEPVANACPPEGCSIKITSVKKNGSELDITWKANFKPDLSRNHVHVFWDNFTPEQVSTDADAKGLVQGEWVPTDAYPSYESSGAMSIGNRGQSTKICVTSANRDHVILDADGTHCLDVSSSL